MFISYHRNTLQKHNTVKPTEDVPASEVFLPQMLEKFCVKIFHIT
jgi:hypothetical protein